MLKEVDIYIWTHFGTQLRQIIALVSATWDRLFSKKSNEYAQNSVTDYILLRAGILQTWHDVLDLYVKYIFISFKKSYEWGGEGKGKRVLEVQFSIFNLQSFFISHYIWHLHKCT